MMNREELTVYKEGIEVDVKAAEQGLERVKLEISNKKKMIKLVDQQIAALPEEKKNGD